MTTETTETPTERYNRIVTEYNELGAITNRTDGQEQRLEDLTRAMERAGKEMREAERAELLARIEDGTAVLRYADEPRPGSQRFSGATRSRPGSEVFDEGRRTIARAFNAGQLPDYAAERATDLIDKSHPNEQPLAALWATAAGAPAYRDAFAKVLADPVKGHLLWTAEEHEAYRNVAAVQSRLNNAMSTTDANGGFLVPMSLDPALLITNAGSINPLRELATVRQTVTDQWRGITTAGATSEWKTEAAEAADGSPTLANADIPMFLGDSFVPYSYEVGMDAMNFLDELSGVLVDSLANLQATAYTIGTGSGQPEGIVTGLAGTSSEINGQGSETTAMSDPFDLQNDLGARFSANAVFLSHIAIANEYRQFETSNGALYFPELRENPPMLCGKPWYEVSNMDSSYDAAATANNYVMLYGDVRRGFFIVDRVGAQLELIPNLVGANQRPTGQRGAILWARTGAKVVVPEALRLLDIPTTA